LALSGLVPYEGDLKLNGQHTPPLVKARSKTALRKVQMVFQMADTALNPRQTVGAILGRVIDVFLGLPKQQKQERIAELLRMVHLPEAYATRRSSELSGGEKQRVNLARALAAEPEIVICDEITSALDTVIVRTIVSLIRSLREKLGVAFVFISHDLSTVSALADRVLVMRKGKIVETGATAAVLSDPQHPYTRLLVDSVPELRVGWLEEVSRGKDRSGEDELPASHAAHA
jgi:peptide/nickel transport system ATP-binding protein